MRRFFLAAAWLLLLVGCATVPAASTAIGPAYPAPSVYPAQGQGTGTHSDYGLENWLTDLAAAGASIKTAAGTADQGFAIQGSYLEVDGKRVSVYEFKDFARAEAAAASVSPDGGTVTRMQGLGKVSLHIDYNERIHWYHKGRLVVSFSGDDAHILDLLIETLGPQFAGGFKLWGNPYP